MDTPENQTETRQLTIAPTALMVLAIMKLFGALFGLRLLAGPPRVPASGPIAQMLAEHGTQVGLTLIVAYGLQFILCIALRRGLKKRSPWSRVLAYVYSIFHIVGILAFPFFGLVAFLSGVLGALVLYGVFRADRSGYFVTSPAV